MTDVTDDAQGQAVPPPRPPTASVAFFLVSLGRSTRELVEARLAEHGLTYQHLSVLGHLTRQPGLSYSELARRAGVTVQSMQATVGQLQVRGLVDPGPRAGQGRRAELRVTDAGRALLGAGEEAVRTVDDDLLADFDPGERAALEATLMRVFRARSAASRS